MNFCPPRSSGGCNASHHSLRVMTGLQRSFQWLVFGAGFLTTCDALGALPAFPGVENRSAMTDPSTSLTPRAIPIVHLEKTIWSEIGDRHHVDPYLLYAIALVESARMKAGFASPWPWALHQGGKTYYPNSQAEALAAIHQHRLEGHTLIDVGLMQVNLHWHGHRVRRIEDLMDPSTNIDLGARILREAIDSVPDNLTLGVGRYHAWRDQKAAERYGSRVIAIRNLLAAQSVDD